MPSPSSSDPTRFRRSPSRPARDHAERPAAGACAELRGVHITPFLCRAHRRPLVLLVDRHGCADDYDGESHLCVAPGETDDEVHARALAILNLMVDPDPDPA